MVGSLRSLLMENGEVIDTHAITDQGVRGRVGIRMAKCHSRQQDVGIGDAELLVHDATVLTPSLLCRSREADVSPW